MIFIRLQAANDAGDLNDLRAFTTPEMFAAVKLDLQERGPTAQRTDVVRVDAEVLDVASEADRQDRQRPLPRPDPRADRRRRRALRRGLAPGQADRRQPRVGDRRHPAGGNRRPFEAVHRHRRVARHGRGAGRAVARRRRAHGALHRPAGERRARRGRRPQRRDRGAMAGRPGRAGRRRRPPAGLARRARRRVLQPGHPGQQRRRADEDRPARGLQRRGALRGLARRPRGAAGPDRRLPARHRPLARRAARAQHLVRPRPAGDGGTGDLLRRQGRHGQPVARGRARPGPARQRRQDRLARARRDRHRHAGAAARQQRQRLSRSADLRQAEGNRSADLEPRRRGPPRRLPRAAPTSVPCRWPTFAIPDASRGEGGRSGCATIRRSPATNSARSTRPETCMSRLALAALATAALLAACAPMPPARADAGRRRHGRAARRRIRRLGEAQRQARRSRGFRRFRRASSRRSRATPTSAAMASSTGIRAGARCWSRIARPAPAPGRSIASPSPMGELEQLTDFAEPVWQASYEPLTGDSIVFERGTGGNEASQIYRLDLASQAGDGRHRAGHAARHGRLAEPEQPAALLLGAARSHRQRRAACRDRADADPGRPGATPMAGASSPSFRAAAGFPARVSWDDRRLAAQPATSPPTIPRSGCSTWPAASAPASCRRRAAPTRRVHLAGAWKRDNSGFFFISDRSGEFRELMFYLARRRPDHADHPPHQGRHRRLEPQPRRQAARGARQGRRPHEPAVLRHHRLQRAAFAGAPRRQRHRGASSIRACRSSPSP